MQRGGAVTRATDLRLLPLDTRALIELVAGWLADQQNWQWLDFGDGAQIVTPLLLKIMTQRETHFLRAYTNDDDLPIGIVGLNSVDRRSRTATVWVVGGEKSLRRRGYATLAGSKLLTLAFRDLGLHAINSWVVEHNPSRRLVERLGFRFVGRQRQCHCIDGRIYDRLLYDLLVGEHRDIGPTAPDDGLTWASGSGARGRSSPAAAAPDVAKGKVDPAA
jgi:RimJ/RimL family protein N-acetyltransferase